MTARAGRALDAQLITSSLSDIERAAEAIQAVLDEPEELVSPEPQQLEIAVKALMEAHRALKATGLIETEPITFDLDSA